MKQVELLIPRRWQSLAIVYEAVRGVHQADHVRSHTVIVSSFLGFLDVANSTSSTYNGCLAR
jgi:hypothetical protein